jgi:NB-ARC domain
MGQGQKDLTGPLARERVLRVIQSLDECGVLNGVDEANALLEAATLPPLFAGNYIEAELMQQLALHRRAAPADDLSLPFAPPFAPRHNLPAQLTSFIGREQEIAQVTLFLVGPITPPMPATNKNLHARKKSDARLITLTGPGGVGKTRLALEVAAALCEDYADGAWWVSLGALSDSSLVTQAILTTFELNRQTQAAPLDVLVGYLEKRRLLLVLDNCEHLVDACAEVTAHLMSYCLNLRILATSREALQVPGEVTSMLCAYSSSARKPCAPISISRRRMPMPSCTSASGWTASRWHWSWRRH